MWTSLCYKNRVFILFGSDSHLLLIDSKFNINTSDWTIPFSTSDSLVQGEVIYYSLPVDYYQQYEVSLSGLVDDADLYVYRDQGGQLFCAEYNSGTGDEICSVNSSYQENGETELNFLLAVHAKAETTYILDVIQQ